MDTVTFQCWFYGDSVKDIFTVQVEQTEYVDGLKTVIKDVKPHKFHDKDSCTVNLYSIPHPGDAHVEDVLSQWTVQGKTNLPPVGPQLADLNLSNCLIIVDDVDMTVNCWVHGDEINEPFPVTVVISRRKTVENLREVIKHEKPVEFANIDSFRLLPYRIPDTTSATIKETARTIDYDNLEPLPVLQRLSNFFPERPPECCIHIIVKVKSRVGHINLAYDIASDCIKWDCGKGCGWCRVVLGLECPQSTSVIAK